MADIGIGLVGAGFAAGIHARMVDELASLGVQVVGVLANRRESAQAFASTHGIPAVYADYDEMLADDRIAIVDLCLPNNLHKTMAAQAAQAGKHIICEKPLTGYFGDGRERAGDISRATMLQAALRDADEMVAAAAQAGVKLMYAENWVYAPAIQKVRALMQASGGTIFDLRAEESHHGSHASYATEWRYTGGGALIRLGSHPIGGMLYLKRAEGLARDGKPITVRSVTAEVATLTDVPSFAENPTPWIVKGWVDVENWSAAILTFSDGTKGTIFANDVCLGGMKDSLEVYLSNARIQCNFSRSNLIEAYAPAPEVFGDEYIVEKLETKAGWSFPAVGEEWALGYHQELRDFVEAVRDDRPPLSDGALGRDVVNVIYSAYLSAEQGARVDLQ